MFRSAGFQPRRVSGASIDLIASEAGVSRQTIYNHYRDKEALLAAVVEDALARMSASMFAVLATFPQTGDNLEHDLVAFSIRMSRNCIYDSSGAFLRKILQANETNLPLAASICNTKGPCTGYTCDRGAPGPPCDGWPSARR